MFYPYLCYGFFILKRIIEDKYPFLKELSDFDLQVLFKELKYVLKSRELLRYDIDTNEPLIILDDNKSFKKIGFNKNRVRIDNDGIRRILSPQTCSLQPNKTKSFLIHFMNEDWKFLFPNIDDTDKKYYVYYHTDLSKGSLRFNYGTQIVNFKGQPFYIGKGCGNRYKDLSKRSTSHIIKVKNMVSKGCKKEQIFNIFMDNLTELEAFELEAKLITFLGCHSEIDDKITYFHGLKGGLLINADISKRPDWVNILIDRILNKTKTIF
jgi:hypothetical protein